MTPPDELVLVKNPTGNDSCGIEHDANGTTLWMCERFDECQASHSACPSGPGKVFIKKSDMVRYAALKLVS